MGIHKLLSMQRTKGTSFDIYNARGEIIKARIKNLKDADAEIMRLNDLWNLGLINNGPYRIYRY